MLVHNTRVLSSKPLRQLCGAGLCLTGLAAFTAPVAAQGTFTNPASAHDITVDGKFTGGQVVGSSFVIGPEWSDITPAAFTAALTPGGSPTPVAVGSPNATALLYAGLDPGHDDVYLMYDYKLRTTQSFAPGTVAADIAFPITVGANGRQNIDVVFTALPGSGFAVTVNGLAGSPSVPASSLGIEGAISFGPSTLDTLDHMLVELSVPLLIPANFGPAFPGAGENGIYSPDPAFWNADLTNNAGDPPISSAIFEINPDGSTFILPIFPSDTPEPGTVALLTGLGASAGIFLTRRRRRTR